ncbi:hypothetical protein ACFQ36_15720 [Arthrobacter sp. GCM10027362]|uniref:hypothetical protein n=1 Tax=Arthrobacter sp. GCM10027362 TaxID=3273379 RepID=UPI003642503A
MSGGPGWLRDPANLPWIVLGLVIALIVIAAGIYVWITRVQPAVNRVLDQLLSGPFP